MYMRIYSIYADSKYVAAFTIYEDMKSAIRDVQENGGYIVKVVDLQEAE